MAFIWLAALVVFAVIEAITVGLTSVWFAVGSLAALISALPGAPLWLQIVLFVAVSGASLVLTRPVAKKYLNSRRVATNADRVFSMVGVVKESIDNLAQTGSVSVDGKEWTARSLSGEPIESGAAVRPVRIDGVKLIVVPAEESADAEEATD